MSGTLGAGVFTNVFYLKFTDDGTQTAADLKTIIDLCVTKFGTRFNPSMYTGVTYTDAKATWITGVGTALEYESSFSNAGTSAGSGEAVNSCYVINWAINQYYRGGHPRTYLPGIVTGNVTNFNSVTSAAQATLATAANNFITDINALTATHVSAVALGTVSFARGNTWRTPPVFYAYKSAGVRNLLGTQRRRIGGR